MRLPNLIAALILMLGMVVSAVMPSHADADTSATVRALVDAVNAGDLATARQYGVPNLALTLPGGFSVPITADQSLPPGLLPITIVSLTPRADDTNTVDGVFQFGASTTVNVQVHATGGVIDRIALLSFP